MPRQPEPDDLAIPLAPEPDDLGVQDWLEAFTDALIAGQDDAIADMWDMPAFALGQDVAYPITDKKQITDLLAEAREQYNARGVIDTRAEIVRVDQINDTLVMVRVHWPWLDGHGEEVGGETSTYTLQRENADSEWKARVVVMHGPEAVN